MTGVVAGVVAGAVTALFVPGSRPDRFGKAARAGADLVIVDLEDAVTPLERADAAQHVLAALAAEPVPQLTAMVRIPDSTDPVHGSLVERLVHLVAQPGHGLAGLMVPKAADPHYLEWLGTTLARGSMAVPLVPLIESAAGVEAVREIARVPGVIRLAFGALDFSLDTDAAVDSETTRWAAAHVVISSRAAGLAGPLDSPSTDIDDLTAVTESTRVARSRGFGGKLCIHPRQLAAVREGFAPTQQERQWAETVLTAADHGVSQVKGRMVDRPVIERARRVLRSPEEQS